VGGLITLKKLIEQITMDYYICTKEAFTTKAAKVQIVNDINKLHNKIEEVGKVKTIWQTEKAVPLSSFYCDTRILVEGQRLTAKSINDINLPGNILVEGIAGQGKSMFMRNLCIRELEYGAVIPVFIELRRLLDENHLLPTIFSRMKEMEFNIDEDLFKYLCANNKIVLLLDGFDEVSEKLQKHVPMKLMK
jgi:NACHT domain.